MKLAMRLPGDVLLDTPEQRLPTVENDHLGTEPAPDAAELEADHAAADHRQALGNLVERQRAGGVYDPLAVEGCVGQGRGY